MHTKPTRRCMAVESFFPSLIASIFPQPLDSRVLRVGGNPDNFHPWIGAVGSALTNPLTHRILPGKVYLRHGVANQCHRRGACVSFGETTAPEDRKPESAEVLRCYGHDGGNGDGSPGARGLSSNVYSSANAIWSGGRPLPAPAACTPGICQIRSSSRT